MQNQPIARDLVLLGGGHSHVAVLRSLGMKPVPGMQVTLISPDVETAYSGMLPGVIAGYYAEADMHIDLVRLCRFAGARFFRSQATALDPVGQVVTCQDRPDVPYDILSVDIGITPSMGVPGAAGRVIPVKPINGFLAQFNAFIARVFGSPQVGGGGGEGVRGKRGGRRIGFVGAGAGGVELCLSIVARLALECERRGEPNAFTYDLFFDSDEVLPANNAAVRRAFAQRLGAAGVGLHPQFRVASVEDERLLAADGVIADVDEIFWVTSAASQPWLAGSGLKVSDDGFVWVSETLQSISHPDVFASGDIANVVGQPRPKAGVFAVRQGKPLVRNLCRAALGQPTVAFRPQLNFLSIIATADGGAVASRGERMLQGGWVWRWKDWIDRRFIAKYNELPAMAIEPKVGLAAEFDDQMRCGGCGSKLDAGLLSEALKDVRPVALPQIVKGLDDPDDAAVVRVGERLIVHSVDGFRAFIDDPYVFAQIAVHHAVSDIHAMGATPVSALVTVTVPYGKPRIMLAVLKLVMAGINRALEVENVALVGGHTSEGGELAVSIAVNGEVDEDRLLGKRGVQPGDQLILTKPLGTGTLFAADMRYEAEGQWIAGAVDMMLQPNGPAAALLRHFDVHACTDVTGFGLAGHLREMLGGSAHGASVARARLPLLAGAECLLGKGVVSSLHAGNRDSTPVAGVTHPRDEILFDPQTAGGLLAAVPASAADACLAALRAGPCPSAVVVGEVVGRSGIELV